MEIEKIIIEMKDDPRNKIFTNAGMNPIIQVDKDARILLIGQAPGRHAQESGIPFADASGKKLKEWMGIDDETFRSKKIAIMSMDFYFPGKAKQGDLPPRVGIADDYHPKLIASMNQLEMVILIGAYAQKYYLGKDAKKNLTETVRAYKEYLPEYFPIVHPSPLTIGWVKKNTWFTDEVIPDLKTHVTKILEK